MCAEKRASVTISDAEALVIEFLCKNPSRPVFVAVDGECASGKTFFAEMMSEKYGFSVVHTDDFFNPGFEHCFPPRVDGNIDYQRIFNQVLLQNGDFIEYDVFDCGLQRFEGKRRIKTDGVVLIEGTYSMHPVLFQKYSLTLFFETSREKQEKRIADRGESVAENLNNIWIPASKRYFDHYGIKEKSDFVVVN